MGKINLLDIQTANLIAAGEVVERPASAVKELCENSIDADATMITVEIRGGGNSYLRVSDNGSGISDDDMPKTILRHATSKIKTGSDLDGVVTLGFRGEALAAIASVSRLQIISRCPGETKGRLLVSNDTEGVVISDTGCPDGTTVIARDLFYNVPARRKFLKKDVTESAAVGAVVEKLALSHPEKAFRFVSNEELRLTTSGDGSLYSAIYTIYGRSFAQTLCEVDYECEGISVSGYISRPDSPRGSRSAQSFFINRRYVKSRTVTAALEEAYGSYIPKGKFPAAILHIEIDPHTVDVNVHPSKSEVKFSNERAIFEAVYYAVRSVLSGTDHVRGEAQPGQSSVAGGSHDPLTGRVISEPAAFEPLKPGSEPMTTAFRQTVTSFVTEDAGSGDNDIVDDGEPAVCDSAVCEPAVCEPAVCKPAVCSSASQPGKTELAQTRPIFADEKREPEYRFIGELFNAYAVVECPSGVCFIDKHAAHERILYEELRGKNKAYAQQLFEPVELSLDSMERGILIENAELLGEYGFGFEMRGETVLLTAIPQALSGAASGIGDYISALVEDLSHGNALPPAERTDRALFTVACKAALKAGIYNDPAHTEWVVRRVMTDERITYCPHGRPVIHLVDRRELDRFFDR